MVSEVQALSWLADNDPGMRERLAVVGAGDDYRPGDHLAVALGYLR